MTLSLLSIRNSAQQRTAVRALRAGRSLRLAVLYMMGSLLLTASPGLLAETRQAIFAGGCFWCSEADFEKVPGVLDVESGYIGGRVDQPTYKEVSAGSTGHIEAVSIRYDSTRIDYDTLLRVFWRSIDPLVANQQFCDSGEQYSSAIFYLNEEQQRAAERSRDALAASGVLSGPIKTLIRPATHFWPAETYHQDYYKKNPIRYQYYRFACGRDSRLEAIWGDEAGWIPKPDTSQNDH